MAFATKQELLDYFQKDLTGEVSNVHIRALVNSTWDRIENPDDVNVGGDFTTAGDIEYLSPFWEDETFSAGSLRIPTVSGPDSGLFVGGLAVQYFDPLSEETLNEINVQFKHARKDGVPVHPHVHWSSLVNGGAGELVGWGLEYSWASIGGLFGATTTIYADQHIGETDIIATKHELTPFASIDSTGKGLSSILKCRLFRDATGIGSTDDYPNDAALLFFDVHYQKDSPGSSTEYAK